MTIPTPQNPTLDRILRHAKHLILDFDGPVCSLYAHQPPGQAADQLRATLAQNHYQIPENIVTTTDPLAILKHAAAINTELARQTEAQLTRCEIDAVATAQPTGYVHDVVASAHESHRTITIISTCARDAVRAYLDRASLTELVGLIITRIGSGPEILAEPDLIGRTLDALYIDPTSCVLVTASQHILADASRHKVATIAYARTQVTRDSLSAYADITIASLADLVTEFRAHPLPR